MRGATLICLKDLRQRVRDRSAFIMALVLPLALALIFNVLLGGLASGTPAFKYALADEDHGHLAAAFSEVLGHLQDQGVIKLTQSGSATAATQLATNGKVDATLVVPAGFTDAVTGGRPAQIRVIGNANATLATQVATSIAQSFAASLNAASVAVATVAASSTAPLTATQLAQLGSQAASQPSPLTVADVSAQRHELDMKTYYSAAMAVLFMFFTVSFGVVGLMEERKVGTLARLLAAPVRRGSVLAGKLASAFVFALVAMAVLIIATSVVMDASWGNPVGVAMLVVAGVLAALGISAMIASFAKSAEQAGNLQAVAAMVLGTLGGTFFPVTRVGGVLGKLSLLTPHAWFLRGLGDLASGAGAAAALPATGAILAFALVAGAVGMLRLPKAVQL